MTPKPDIYDRRFIITFVTCAILLVTIVLLRPQKESGLVESKFSLAKLKPETKFDVVAVGDSRVLHSIDPQSFHESSPSTDVHNFGFQGAALSKGIIAAAEALLKDDGDRILVCGITPNTFTPDANNKNAFLDFQKSLRKRSFAKFTPKPIDFLARQLEPVAIRDLSRYARGDFKSGVHKNFHENGWVETWVVGKHNPLAAIPLYRRRFVNNMPSEENIAAFLESTREATNKGLTVIGFQPPVPTEMIDVENEKSGFSYEKFVPRFESSGGQWVQLEETEDVRTYDGSHLDRDSARQFSKRFGTRVLSQLQNTKTTKPQAAPNDAGASE